MAQVHQSAISQVISQITVQPLLRMAMLMAVRFTTMAQVHQSVISRVISQITVQLPIITLPTAVRFITKVLLAISQVILQVTQLLLMAVRFATIIMVQSTISQATLYQILYHMMVQWDMVVQSIMAVLLAVSTVILFPTV